MKPLKVLALCGLLVVVLVQGASAGAEPTFRYPNLVPLPPEGFAVPGTTFYFGGPTDAPVVLDGCLLDEIVRRNPRRCLRFDTRVANVGEGAFEVIYRAETSGETTAYQRIYTENGSSEESLATDSEFHPTHAHFHIDDFYVARLWASRLDGRPKGIKPLAASSKNGFCPEDSETISGEEDTPEHYNCAYPPRWDFEQSLPGTVVGISAGWMDTYGANLPDQYVDIAGLGDGSYVLQMVIDPNDVFQESDETDNTVCTLFTLGGDEAVIEGTVPCGRRRAVPT